MGAIHLGAESKNNRILFSKSMEFTTIYYKQLNVIFKSDAAFFQKLEVR